MISLFFKKWKYYRTLQVFFIIQAVYKNSHDKNEVSVSQCSYNNQKNITKSR